MDFTTRAPLATYEQAIWRLCKYETSEGYSPEQIELAVEIVADVFWLSEAKVRHDMTKAVRSLALAASPHVMRKQRGSRYVGAL